MALFFLAFLVGEGPPPIFRLGLQQNLQFFGMAGLFAGLLLAWKWEGWGGLLALASFVLLNSIDRRFNSSWFFVAPALIAGLHIVCWWRIAAGPPAAGTAWQVPRRALWVVRVLVGVFVLLCANEIFLNPPLMTPSRPPADLAGTWKGKHVEFRIHADGRASWSEYDFSQEAMVRPNRSWFGNLMHWREPYTARSDSFTAHFSIRNSRMTVFYEQKYGSYRLDLEKQ